MLSIGMGLWGNVAAVSGGGGGFTPASLSPDVWIEADPTKLYTDAGTTLVSADGQAVWQANDKSTNSRNLTQTVLVLRPLYKTDLSKPSLLFDGTQTKLDSASNLTWGDGSGQHWFAISCRPSQTASNKEVCVILSSAGGYFADINMDSSAVMEVENAALGFEADGETGIVSGTDVVVIGTATTSALEAFVNNATNGAHTLTGGLRTTTGQLLLGGNNTVFAGRIFGLVHGQGVLNSTDRSNLQTYMAALHP